MKSVQKNEYSSEQMDNRNIWNRLRIFTIRTFRLLLNREPRKHVKKSSQDNRLMLVLSGIIRFLPSMTVVLIMTTLLVYLTVGPGAETTWIQPMTNEKSVSENDQARAQMMHSFELDDDAFAQMNRGQYWDHWYGVNESAVSETTETMLIQETTDPTLLPAELTVTDPVETMQPGETQSTTESQEIQETTAATQPTEAPDPTPVTLESDAYGVIQEPLDTDAFESAEDIVYVSAFHANIRSEPRTDAAVLQSATMGDTLNRFGIGSYWSGVALSDGTFGYIYNDLITTSVVYKPEPTEQPEPTTQPEPTAQPEPTTQPEPTKQPEPTEKPSDTSTEGGLTDGQKQEMVALARSMLGVKYVYGGSSPSGFDCSGFTLYIYQTLHGITLPHKAAIQASQGISVSSSEITTGDILCFDWSYPYGQVDHVGLYIGNGQYIHASYSRGSVVESTVNFSRNPIVSIRRIIP